MSGLQKHRRVGPGKCACGFDAYTQPYMVLDYGEELGSHIRSENAREREEEKNEDVSARKIREQAKSLAVNTRRHYDALRAEGFSSSDAFELTKVWLGTNHDRRQS